VLVSELNVAYGRQNIISSLNVGYLVHPADLPRILGFLGNRRSTNITMPPARPRIDDSRSETSQSTMTNFKSTAQNGISKGKKPTNTSSIPSSLSRTVAASTTAIPPDSDPNLPRTNWTTFPTPVLHAYVFTNKLQTPSSYTHPHADILHKSSEVALRSPTQVAARRRLRDLKAARRRDSTVGSGLLKGKEVSKERERSSERLKQSVPDTLPVSVSVPSLISAQRQTAASLALAVRRHFNSAQVNEGDAIARFLYVVRHGGRGDADSKLIGRDGDGRGRVIGSAGRAVEKGLGISGADGNKDEGGGGCDLGFRLRFRPRT
jgi:hypothetical protein